MSYSSNKRVLIVDDEPNIVKAVNFLLTQHGFTTARAYNGLQALQKIGAFQPDLVVLDVMMPEMNGFQVARQIRANPANADVVIIFLTAKGTTRDKMQGYSTGGDIYITKPFDNEELIQAVSETLAYG